MFCRKFTYRYILHIFFALLCVCVRVISGFVLLAEDTVHSLDLDVGLKQSLKKGLSIVGLRKIYEVSGRSNVAVDNLNLDLYEGQTLALLGHNGAGKTTVM